MTNSDSYNNDQLEEVWTWLHDEKRCVTTQTVSLTMGLPRTVAAALLQNVVKYKDNSDKYEVTKCCLVKEDNKTSKFELSKGKIKNYGTFWRHGAPFKLTNLN
jgi:hypothetical protein